MSNFLAILSLYYACDALLLLKPMALTEQELTTCSASYEAVKSQFSEQPFPSKGTMDGVAARRAAYRAFKAWEMENGTLVTQMRQDASQRIKHGS